MRRLKSIDFENDFTTEFKGDKSGNLHPRLTPDAFYSKAVPTPVPAPKLLAWNTSFAEELEIAEPTEEDLEILAGNKILPSMFPYASCYGGHQFGNWAGQLGDGRAINLGGIHSNKETWELQLKGAGPTAYSRGADGRAVLRSSVREYLMSEAMYYLGIPTTRVLSLATTGEEVTRDMFYDGNPKPEPGAVISRLAPTFLRFGSFEILTARNEIENLQKLVAWTIDNYYPHLQGENKVLSWFSEIVEKTASLMVEWQRVGFVHGVMNTDNMSILGLTIDYGPFSFLDRYDLKFTPNTTDLPGKRYAFGNQASVAYWNLGRLASAILPLFDDAEPLEEVLLTYENIFWDKYYQMMSKKLGLDEIKQGDKQLISKFEEVLSLIQPDMTIFYRLLISFSEEPEEEEKTIKYFESCFYKELENTQKSAFLDLLQKYSKRIKKNKISRKKSKEKMKKANPKFILRNYLLHQAIEELENGNDRLFRKLKEAIKDPYSDEMNEFFLRRPEWANKKAGCSMLSCSS